MSKNIQKSHPFLEGEREEMGRPKLSVKKRERGQRKVTKLTRTGKGGANHKKKKVVTPSCVPDVIDDGYETEIFDSTAQDADVASKNEEIKRFFFSFIVFSHLYQPVGETRSVGCWKSKRS